jgi:beta-glucosidase
MDENPKTLPYRDPQLSIEARVNDLLTRMTVDEKIAQIGGVWSTALIDGKSFSEAKAREAIGDGIGHVSRIGAATTLRPDDSARVANAIQRFLVENTRLGIPAIVHEESCAGYCARDATCFPQAIGLAATWDPPLVEEMTEVIRGQMRAVGAHQALAPVLDVARDPRWGRVEETFGEDPYLISRIGVAYIKGLQGEDLRRGIVATGKHFLGYGASEGGMNWAPAHIPERELLEVYATPFEAAIREARLASMMNAYHELDGVPCGASPELLETLLRDKLGFDGVTVSDYFTLLNLVVYHRIAADKAEAARLALEAGIDVELPVTDCYGDPLRDALADGRVDMALVDRSVARVLRMKFELGLFENPYVDADAAPAVFDTPEQRRLAARIARESIILLKNDGDLLPLSKDVKTLAVIGPSADSVRLLQGDYHYPTHQEMAFGPIAEGDLAPRPGDASIDARRLFVPMVSVLEGIRRKGGRRTEVLSARGCETLGDSTARFDEAVAVARRSEVAVVVIGGRSGLVEGCTSGESIDRADLGLPGVQQALVEAVVATGTPTVVVVIDGRPLALPWIAEHVPSVLFAWLPGEEGGAAIADIVFGDAAPGGKLPVSLPRSVGQVPVYYGHKPSGGRTQWKGDYVDLPAKPLFCFGHGLSYTTFDYSDLELSAGEVPADGAIDVSATVTNVGLRPGEEVVQLYLHDVVASLTRPVKELKGFQRVALAPGESRRLTFHFDVRQLAFYDRDMQFVVEPGEVEVFVGSSSEDVRLSGGFQITGGRLPVRRSDPVPTTVTIR